MVETKERENEYKTSDQVLAKVGEFGLFQKLLDGVVCLIYFFIGYQVLIMYFMTLTPSWKCKQNSTECPFNGTLPEDDYSRCNMSRKEWYYTKPSHYSLVTQFDIHCDQYWLLELLSSIHFAGWGIGAVILGWIGDKFGRKILLFPSVAIIILINIISAFAPNVYIIVVCRFVVGFLLPGAMVQSSILISEFVGNKHRPFATLIPFFTYSVGFACLALKAYYLQNWKWLSIACSAPYILIIVFYPFVPESAKWLQMNKRNDEAMEIFRKIARWNKKELPSNIRLQEAKTVTTNSRGKDSETFWNPSILFKTLIQCFLWMVTSMCFFGLQLAANQLEGSIYRDFTLLSIVQIPAVVIAITLNTKIGRKKTNLIALFIAGTACLSIAFVPSASSYNVYRIVLALLGKVFVTTTFQSLYLWSGELFSITIRSQGMGYTQIAARLGATGSPWVVKGLKPFGATIPFIVIAIPTLLGSLIGLWLPETNCKSTKQVENGIENNVTITNENAVTSNNTFETTNGNGSVTEAQINNSETIV